MRSSFFVLNIILASLSAGLTLAVLACSGHALSTFNNQQSQSAWLLPVWRDHFDVRDLQLLVATSVVILVLNLAHIATTIFSKVPAAAINATTTGLSTAVALVALVFPSAMTSRKSDFTDTLSSWTCSWSAVELNANDGPTSQFATMCRESRFSYYAIIPIFIVQLVLLSVSIYAPVASRRKTQMYGHSVEKGQSLDAGREESLDAGKASKTTVVATTAPVQA